MNGRMFAGLTAYLSLFQVDNFLGLGVQEREVNHGRLSSLFVVLPLEGVNPLHDLLIRPEEIIRLL